MAFQIGLKAVNILHRQGYDGAVPIGTVEDDRTGQVPLACQLEDLRRIVADKQRRTFHGNQGIVLVKTRQNGRGILLHDNGQLHVGTDGGKVDILACHFAQAGCRLLQHGQDAEEILPASGAELSFGELCAIGEQVEQEAAFSAKEAMRNKIKARRDAERYKSTGTDSEQRTPNPFEDSSAIATESPKNEDTLNTMRKHADAQPTKSAGIKTSKKQSLVETTRELKKYIHIISCGGVLYYHNEYYYTQLDSKQLIKLYRQNVDYELNNESSLRGYKDLYDCLVTDPQIECSEPEDEPIYAPLENGILDLMEWKLYPHSPDQITFTCIKAKYDSQAKCQIFEEYLQRVTGGDSLLSERVWMAIGYLLIYPARGKFFIFMKGIGNSGKSVLGSFIRRLYPKESISSIRLKQMKNEFGMSSLANAVINFDMDMPSSKIDEEAASRLKQITGGDSINVPRKFRDDALLERRIKFVFSSNHPIIIDGEDDALLKRIIYLPFNYAIPDDQQDPDLGDKIWKERDAIATKALRYARKLVKLNYIFPEIPQMDNAKCIVRDSIAKTVGKFVQESCDKSESKAVTATEDLYNAYSDYCKEKNMWACSQKAFTKELTQMKIEHTRFRCTGEDMIARKNPVSAFKGIKLRP